ncbi:MAG: GNAT family N-acetyltransferase [Thermaerobacter sp.]|nr:GNAT family N-acetyltransferase [Thermaerobacter sp.]
MDTLLVRRGLLRDARGIAEVLVDTWRTTYQGIVPQPYLDSLSYDSSEQRWLGILANEGRPSQGERKLVHVAESNGRVVGFVVGGAERRRSETSLFDGELYAIYILVDHQGRGLGRRLVRALGADLQEIGLKSMLVWVLAENPSRYFYEALGGQLVDHKTTEIGGVALDELGYGWADLTSL